MADFLRKNTHFMADFWRKSTHFPQNTHNSYKKIINDKTCQLDSVERQKSDNQIQPISPS